MSRSPSTLGDRRRAFGVVRCWGRSGIESARDMERQTPNARRARSAPHAVPGSYVIFDRGGTEWTSQTLPPITEPSPITVSPPRMVAPE
jgi:hypothetical protein